MLASMLVSMAITRAQALVGVPLAMQPTAVAMLTLSERREALRSRLLLHRLDRSQGQNLPTRWTQSELGQPGVCDAWHVVWRCEPLPPAS